MAVRIYVYYICQVEKYCQIQLKNKPSNLNIVSIVIRYVKILKIEILAKSNWYYLYLFLNKEIYLKEGHSRLDECFAIDMEQC